MREWTWRGRPVRTVRTTDISNSFRLGGQQDHLVQAALDEMPPWQRGKIATVTVQVQDALPLLVVPVGFSDEVLWAKHSGHYARQVKVSPFVKVSQAFTYNFTIHLAESPGRLILARAYAGSFQWPLPWRRSAEKASGGIEACITFWSEHAYVFSPSIIVPGSLTDRPPDWYRH